MGDKASTRPQCPLNPHLRSRNNVKLARQNVDQLPLALVAPLGAQYNDDLGVGAAHGGRVGADAQRAAGWGGAARRWGARGAAQDG